MASYKTYHYKTEWEGRDNIVITLLRDDGVQCGIIEVAIFKGGEHDGESLLWNLHVLEQYRGIGLGKRLLDEAYQVACQHNCHTATLEWLLKDSPRWVLQWYVRQGFDEKEFGEGYALLKKNIKNQETR